MTPDTSLFIVLILAGGEIAFGPNIMFADSFCREVFWRAQKQEIKLALPLNRLDTLKFLNATMCHVVFVMARFL